jgi:hypothetical protein
MRQWRNGHGVGAGERDLIKVEIGNPAIGRRGMFGGPLGCLIW